MSTTKKRRLDGRELMLYRVDPQTGKADPKAFACAKSCSLNINTEFEEITDKDTSVFNEKEIKRFTWDASTQNLISEFADLEGLIATQLAGERFAIRLSLTQNIHPGRVEETTAKKWIPTTDSGYYGEVLISSLQITASVDGKAEYTANFSGVGELKPLKAKASGATA